MKALYSYTRTVKTLVVLFNLCFFISCAEKITPLTDVDLAKELLAGTLNTTGQQYKIWKIDSMTVDNVGQELSSSQLNYFQRFEAIGSWSDFDGLNGLWDMPNQNSITVTIDDETIEYFDVNVLSFMLKMKRVSDGQTLEYFYKIEN